jgi:Transposase DDE domain
LKESKYVRLAYTIYRVLRNSRIPLFLHRKSNHVFSVWQHIVLLTVRQYEGKSYRMFVEWLIEAYYLRTFLQLSHIPHYTTLQKFAARINGILLERIISSFILLLTNIRKIFAGIDSTGFKITHASQYYTERTGLRRKYAKLSIGADVLQQIICTIKIRRAPTRHDNIDFRPIITRTSDILPLSVVTADKGYDSEDNHLLVREDLHAFSVIPARYEHVPIWTTHGRYRKQMKRGYCKVLYNQRNKDETIISVIKRLFGEHITSRLVRTQNRELSFRCIAYNTHRLTNLTIITWFLLSRFEQSDVNILITWYERIRRRETSISC